MSKCAQTQCEGCATVTGGGSHAGTTIWMDALPSGSVTDGGPGFRLQLKGQRSPANWILHAAQYIAHVLVQA